MTCILGLEPGDGSVWLAADRLIGDEGLSDVLPHSKILRLSAGDEEFLLAVAGNASLYGVLRHRWAPPPRDFSQSFDGWWWGSAMDSLAEVLRAAGQLHEGGEDASTAEVIRGSFLVGMRGEVWSIFESLTPERSRRPYAGQGACLIAFGALFASLDQDCCYRLNIALEAARSHQPGLVQRPFDVECLEPAHG